MNNPGYAETQQDGVFDLTTYTLGDGAMAGDYVVTITWEEPPLAGYRPQKNGPSREQMKKWVEQEQERRKKKAAANRVNIPEVYADPARTPLRQKVPPPGKVEFNLDGKAK